MTAALQHRRTVTSMSEAAMNKIGVDVGVKLIAGGMNFRAIGEIMWFKRKGEDRLKMGVRFMGLNRDDRSIWNKVLLSLGEEAQAIEASKNASVVRSS